MTDCSLYSVYHLRASYRPRHQPRWNMISPVLVTGLPAMLVAGRVIASGGDGVCMCVYVCLHAQNLEICRSEINVTW